MKIILKNMVSNMKLLIDGSTSFLELALIDDNNKIVDTSFEIQNKNLTKILINNIENILKKNYIKKENINSIYVVNGPGSFTSIKLIATMVNTWKTIYNSIELYEINTCLFYTTSNNSFSFLYAKTEMYYCQIIDNKKEKINILHKDKFNEIKEKLILQNYSIIDCSIKKDINEKWEFNKNNFTNVNKITPLYLKEAI